MPLIMPNSIENDTPADAAEVEQNFSLIETYTNTNLINRDGSIAMQQPLMLPGNPTQPNHAANKDYVDSKIAYRPAHISTAAIPIAGSWGTSAVTYPPSPATISTWGLPNSDFYTAASGCTRSGVYGVSLQFTASVSDTTNVVLATLFGTGNAFSSEGSMHWAGVGSYQQMPCNAGIVIHWAMHKLQSNVTWPASWIRIGLSYLGA